MASCPCRTTLKRFLGKWMSELFVSVLLVLEEAKQGVLFSSYRSFSQMRSNTLGSQRGLEHIHYILGEAL